MPIRYAPVVPPACIDLVPVRGKIADKLAYFCFADVAYENPDYADFFADKKYVIIDSPVFEAIDDKILDAKRVRELLLMIPQAEFTIVPDVIDSYNLTLSKFYTFCEHIDHPSLTGVPQGRTLKEALQCARIMAETGIQRLAIPNKRAWKEEATRTEFVTRLEDTIGRQMLWHFLGADFPYRDERIASRNLPQVISVDTAEPINAAYYHRSLRDGIVNRPEGFLDAKIRQFGVSRVYYNIKEMQEWLVATMEE